MSNNESRPIVVKKIKKSGGGHHGGAWKIAYADFVTAMMAFFLLMWLLGSTAKGDLNGIAEYFQTPLKVAMSGGSGSGDSSSLIKGGGENLTKKEGQIKKGETPQQRKTASPSAAHKASDLEEMEKLKGLKARIEKMIDSNANLRKFSKQLLLDITAEGLRIQIVDEKNRPMFELAKADLQPYTKDILHEIGKALNDVPNRVSLSGHTDAAPYASGEKGFSNWELSSDRANASRRELIIGGMQESKVLRVLGMSSAILFDRADPLNPVNRRISIIVMNKRAEQAAEADGSNIQVSGSEDVNTILGKKTK